MTATGRRSVVVDAFRQQVDWCRKLGSPFTAGVLTLVADDVAAGGPAAALVGDWPGDPVADALALRLAGALHALVLRGAAPGLARLYPPAAEGSESLGPAVRDALLAYRPSVEAFLASPPQTNEVGRSGVLIGGFLAVARETGLPLRTLEIGASAGLNSCWDGFRYRLGGAAWGDPASRVILAPDWEGPAPDTDASVRVVERRCCDVAPVDIADPAARLRLAAYVWPDQRERLARLRGALSVAERIGPAVDRADAAAWLRDRLGEPAPGRATVLFHSIMWQYMPEATRVAIRTSLDAAGARADAAAPLAWLRFEPSGRSAEPELRLTLWPGGEERVLASAQAHGNAVRWFGR